MASQVPTPTATATSTPTPPPGETLILARNGVTGESVSVNPWSAKPGTTATFIAPGYLDRATHVPADGGIFLWPITVDAAYVETIVYDTSAIQDGHLNRWDRHNVGVAPGLWQGARDEIASTGTINLVDVDEPPDIEIKVDPSDPEFPQYGAYTRCNADGNTIIHCSISLVNDSLLMHPLLIHELGHCLGLGHSPRDQDLMHPIVSASHFSSDEKALLTMMYRWRRPGNAPPDDDTMLAAQRGARRVIEFGDRWP